MAVFSCNGCGETEEVLIDLGYCPSCALDHHLITGEEFDAMTADDPGWGQCKDTLRVASLLRGGSALTISEILFQSTATRDQFIVGYLEKTG